MVPPFLKLIQNPDETEEFAKDLNQGDHYIWYSAFPNAKLFVLIIIGCITLAGCMLPTADDELPVLTRENNAFKLNGEPISQFGLRAANALQSDDITERLINSLGDLKRHGMQSIAVTIQGGRYTEGGNSAFNGFNQDGTLDSVVSARLVQLLDEMAHKNMVPVVMLFYRGRDQELEDGNAVRNAVVNTIELLKPWPHAWVHVINEPYHGGFDQELLTSAEGHAELYELARQTDPDRIVYVSHEPGANGGFYSDTWGRIPEINPPANGNVSIEYVRGESYNHPGVFDEGDRPYQEVDDYRTEAIAHARETYEAGGYWFWHAAWHQKADEPGWPRFDKGGSGTADEPGVSFIWDIMRDLTLMEK